MRVRQKGGAAGADGSQRSPAGQEEDTPVGMPPGFGFAPDTDEEGGEDNLEDLEGEETGEEGEQEDEAPEPLTPEEVKALHKQLQDSQAMIGRLGDELGELRRGRQAESTPQPQTGMLPVQGQGPDPFEVAYKQATDAFLADANTGLFAQRINQITNAKMSIGLQYAEKRLEERDSNRSAETKAEVDFFTKHVDLVDGLPRSIFEGELAKAKLGNPRGLAREQREEAAKATRQMMQDLNYRLVGEDEAARREGRRLQGPRGRKSRTGSTPSTGLAGLAAAAQSYRSEHYNRQEKARS